MAIAMSLLSGRTAASRNWKCRCFEVSTVAMYLGSPASPARSWEFLRPNSPGRLSLGAGALTLGTATRAFAAGDLRLRQGSRQVRIGTLASATEVLALGTGALAFAFGMRPLPSRQARQRRRRARQCRRIVILEGRDRTQVPPARSPVSLASTSFGKDHEPCRQAPMPGGTWLRADGTGSRPSAAAGITVCTAGVAV